MIHRVGAYRSSRSAADDPINLRWLREQANKASLRDDKRMLRWLDRFLAGRELESISRTIVEAIIEAKQAEGCTNATVNRHLALLRAILGRCVRDWEWLDRAPTIRLLKEPTRRIRFRKRLSKHVGTVEGRRVMAKSAHLSGTLHVSPTLHRAT